MVSKAYPGVPRYVLAFVHLGQLSHLGNRNFVQNDIVVTSIATIC